MPTRSFTAQLKGFVGRTETRINAVVQTAAQDMVARVQRPQAKGGNMPVVTGTLKNSLMAGKRGMPSGTSSPQNATQVALAITRLELGDDLWLGYVANYARAMEARYAFVRLAAQQWQQLVDGAARKVRSSYP